ncbi:MAG: ornithine carbamoyltransferase [Lachnospiraceae bacterium]|nr:ornithine carbamoyltransferase [Lachnospiraceae bacterium]
MAVNLKGRSFLTLMDFTPAEIRYMLDLAHDLKAKKRLGLTDKVLTGKNIVLLFEKTSTRTRCSFEVAAMDEGAGVTFLDSKSSQMGKKESIADTAKVLGRLYDGIEYRGYKQEIVEALAKYSGVPVWNGLTDVDHPTQILADLMTIEEHVAKPLNKVKVVFVGDVRNNMAYAWMYGCAKMGMEFVAYGPQELCDQVDPSVKERAEAVANETGAKLTVTSDVAAIAGADVIYTDIWASMGEEDQIPERVRLLTPFKVTGELMAKTGNPECIFMHCLPSFHDFNTTMAAQQMELGYDIREVTDEVFLGKNSVVFDEAENRLHTIKAVVVATIA